jgi:hypothetical protein
MMMQAVTTTLALSALPVAAEQIRCVMENDVPLAFDIDPNQFAPALDPNEPPRQQRTIVRFGDKQFPATPFYIGDTRGFEAEGLGGTTTLFVMQPDGTARFSDARAGTRNTGNCTVSGNTQ